MLMLDMYMMQVVIASGQHVHDVDVEHVHVHDASGQHASGQHVHNASGHLPSCAQWLV